MILCVLSNVVSFCFSKSWSGTGFFVNVKFNKKNEVVDAYCIMTNHHVYLAQKNTGAGMVAVFHHDSTEKESYEILLEPFKIFAHSKGEVCLNVHQHLYFP